MFLIACGFIHGTKYINRMKDLAKILFYFLGVLKPKFIS
jgi:hypothetical protein